MRNVLTWIPKIVIAFANGTLRELVLRRFLSEPGFGPGRLSSIEKSAGLNYFKAPPAS